MAFLLAKKILEYLIYIMCGFVLVKLGVLKSEDSNTISKILLYLICPCVLLSAFQVTTTTFVLRGLLVGFVVSFMIYLIFIAVDQMLKKFGKGSIVERGTVVYTNCGNLLFPLVNAVFGPAAMIYLIPYNVLFHISAWTYGVKSFHPGSPFDLKKALLNINIIVIVIGLIMMLTGIRLSGMPMEILEAMGSVMGPLSMIVIGLVMANLNFKMLSQYKRLPFIIILRMVICPGIVLFLYWITKVTHIFPDCQEVLMITLLCAAAPAANIVTQFAVLFDDDAEYASALGVVSTLICIATLPVFILLFERL